MTRTHWSTKSLIAVAMLAIGTTHAAIAEPTEQVEPTETKYRLRLEMELTDGSRLFGEPCEANPTIGLQSRVGKVNVPLAELAHIEVHADQETVAVQWPKGDRLTGTATAAGFEVNTVLGKLHVPLASLKRCAVQVIAADKPIKPAKVSASGGYLHKVPANILDGNNQTIWSSGAYSGWIELDLGAVYELASIEAELQFAPVGPASHQFYISDRPMQGNIAGAKLVKSFNGTRRSFDVLAATFSPGTTARYVQIRCTRSVAWFNLFDVEVRPRL